MFGLVAMLLGVLSDSHDNLPMIEAAVKALEEAGVEHVLHCGDVISPFTVPHFRPFKGRMTVLLGNNDGDHLTLSRRFSELDIEVRLGPCRLTLDRLHILALHGYNGPDHTEKLARTLAAGKEYNAIIFGHTHRPLQEHRDDTLLLNPGEVCGYLTGQATVAVLDTETRKAEIINLEG